MTADIFRKIYGRYMPADMLRLIYYGRYTTADILKEMHYSRYITADISRPVIMYVVDYSITWISTPALRQTLRIVQT